MVAEVLVEINFNSKEQTFSYLIPSFINVSIGSRVLVPFGNRKLEGFVLDIHENNNTSTNLKTIENILDENPVLTSELIELGKYMSKKTISSLISCYQAMLPKALKAKAKVKINKKLIKFIKLNIDYNEALNKAKNDKQKEIINSLKNGEKKLTDISCINSSYKTLLNNGILKEILEEEYRIKTIIKGDYVYKQNLNEKSIAHIKMIEKNIDILKKCDINTLDRYENSTIISAYQKDKNTLDKILIEKLKQGNVEEIKRIMKNLYLELQNKLEVVETDKNVFDKYKIEYEKEDINNLTFIKYGFWDMILQNIFYIDNKYFLYDQEWIEENIPIEFLVYRTIAYNPEVIKHLNLKELLNEFNITDKNISLFQILDNKLQEKTRNETAWKIHTQVNNVDKILSSLNAKSDEIKKLQNDKEIITQECQKLLNEKDARIKFLEDNMETTVQLLHEKENQILLMKNSTSWKITEPLRKIRGKKGAEK